MPEPLGIGIIGLGVMGRIHVGILKAGVPGACLAAVADLDPERSRESAEETGVPAYTACAELLRDPAVHAVVIATPAETHSDLIEQAAAAGKHIFCEKPLDVDLTRIHRALAAVKQARVLLMTGFNRRFDRNFSYLREELDAGRIGDPISIHIVSRDPVLAGPPRTIEAKAGLFFETTIHDLDMLRFLTGAEIEWLHVQASSPVHKQPAVDSAVVMLRLANGAAATIDNSQAAYDYDQRIEAFGTQGALTVTNETVNTVSLWDRQGIHSPRHQHFFPQRYRESYSSELAAFAGFVPAGVQPSPSGADGRAATAAALAVQLSFEQRRPVRIEEVR